MTAPGLLVKSSENVNCNAVSTETPPVTAIPVIEPSKPLIVGMVTMVSLITFGVGAKTGGTDVDVYPVPGFVIVVPVTTPFVTVAVAIAVIPIPVPVLIGGDIEIVNPDPT